MTLTDAGAQVALIDADESDHEICVQSLQTLTLPLLTTWPAFTEAMYLLGRAGGSVGQQALWKLQVTLNDDFRIYRIHGRSSFEIVPAKA